IRLRRAGEGRKEADGKTKREQDGAHGRGSIVYCGAMTAAVDLVRRHPLMTRLTSEQVRRFAAAGELEVFGPGEEIVVEGTLGEALYLILSERADVIVTPGEGAAPPLSREGRRLASLQ